MTRRAGYLFVVLALLPGLPPAAAAHAGERGLGYRESARFAAACEAADDSAGESVQLLQTKAGSASLLATKAAPPAGGSVEAHQSTSFILSQAARPLPTFSSSTLAASSPSPSPSPSPTSSHASIAAAATNPAAVAAAAASASEATATVASRPEFLVTDGREVSLLQVTEFSEGKSSLGTTAVGNNVLFIVLPALGFGFALVSIVATIFFETGVGQSRAGGWKGTSSDSPGGSPFQRPGAMRGTLPGLGAAGSGGGAAGGMLYHGGTAERYYRLPPNKQALGGPPPEAGGTGFLYGSPKPDPQVIELAQGEVEVTVPLTTQGQIIGLTLSEDDLTVTSFADPLARRYGFQLGDKILSVNGVHVKSEEDFLMRLKDARIRNATYVEPIVFRVHRGSVAASQDPSEWLGSWEYQESSLDPGSIRRFNIKRELHELLFEQEVPDGLVRGTVLPRQRNIAEAQLGLADGRLYGSVLLQLVEKGVLLLRSKQEGTLTYGMELRANKVSEPASRRKKGGCLC